MDCEIRKIIKECAIMTLTVPATPLPCALESAWQAHRGGSFFNKIVWYNSNIKNIGENKMFTNKEMYKFEFGIRGAGSGFDINWFDLSEGTFGHIVIKESDNSEILLDSEHLSKETVKKMLSDLIDQATLID
jgi:hypothetical protein